MSDVSDSENSGLQPASNKPLEGEYKYRLDQLLSIGSAVCREIKRFQPDFVAILLHGGWVIYHAAFALWQQTEQAEFPPIFPINLGREKEERYKEHRLTLPISRYHIFAGIYSDSGEIGYFLNWVAEQKDWMAWIRDQTGKMGFDRSQIQRILILDDTYFEGSTFYLAQQLFETSFPDAEVRFLSGLCKFFSVNLVKLFSRFLKVHSERCGYVDGTFTAHISTAQTTTAAANLPPA